ncbi:hypothetical protein [Streptomyces sp. NPDC127084]|uniref:hypothetical protein n=1 Tax=Streptomyces sp. NPDC127084 TaxID=3347133 RepID=UPI00365E2822
MDSLVYGLCTLVGMTGTAHAVREVWRQRRRAEYRVARGARIVASGLCTIGVILCIPLVEDAVESVADMNNVARLAAHACFIITCGSIQVMLVDWSYTPESLTAKLYTRTAFTFCVVAALVSLFIATTGEDVEFTTQYAATPGVTIYLMVYLAYLAVTFAEVTYFCSGMAVSAHKSGHIRSATGLGMSAVAAVLGIVFTASKGSYLMTRHFGHPWSLRAEKLASPVLAGLTMIMLTVGLIMAAAGRRVQPEQASASTLG